MLYVIYLMTSNMQAAAGTASDTLFFKLIPYAVVGLTLGSMLLALYWRKARPDLYDRIGSTIFDDREPVREPAN